MLTYTQLYTRAADIVGIDSTTNSQDLTNIKTDINQGLRLFKNAARRYWTRTEKSANLVSGQQYYQLPPDCVRVTEVKIVSNGLVFPVVQVDSEAIWNKINIIPAMTINLPRYFFIRGNNEIGLWPLPSASTTNGLVVSYEPRLPDMSVDDVTDNSSGFMASVTAGSTTVTLSGNAVVPQMVGRWFQVDDGTDGNWYQIGIYDSTTQFELVNNYEGISGSSKSFIIGQAPDIPEDYHLGLVYYAAYNYYLKRNDDSTAIAAYKALFEDLLNQYKENYAAKTTGLVQANIENYTYNPFTMPPNPIT